MSSLARLIEKVIEFVDVDPSESSAAISLDGADKFSVQVTATGGDSIAHLEVSNVRAPSSDSDWTEIDSFSIAEGESDMFEQANSSFLWARITLENDDVAPVSAECLALVIGDAE